MRTGSATARTTGRRTWLFCAAWLSIWPRWSPQKRRSRVSSSAPDGITPTWSPSSPKPQKAKCDSPGTAAALASGTLTTPAGLRQGGCVPGERPRGAACLLRFPRRALEALTDHEPNREHVRDDPPSHGALKELPVEQDRARPDLQAG